MTDTHIAVRPLIAADWPQVAKIYAAGIATGHATFEVEPPSWQTFDTTRLSEHRLVAVDAAGLVVGWTAVTPVSDRCAYSGVVEHSVYVAQDASGRGIGRQLLAALIESTETAGIWTIQSGIFPENRASLAVHQAVGFKVIGVRERIGRMSHGPMAGQWRDVVFIERRSDNIGA